MDKVETHWNNVSDNYNKWGKDLPQYSVVSGYLHILLALKKDKKDLKKARLLDFGCGAGKTNIFFNIYFDKKNITGVDISERMVETAKANDPSGNYKIINGNGIIPLNEPFDYAMTGWVILAINSLDKMVISIKEVYRLLKPNGLFVALVDDEASVGIQNPLWKYGDKNKTYEVGDKIIVSLTDPNTKEIVHVDAYFWTKDDYCKAFHNAGFKEVESYIPCYDGIETKKEIEYLKSIGFIQGDIDYEELVNDRPTRIIVGKKIVS